MSGQEMHDERSNGSQFEGKTSFRKSIFAKLFIKLFFFPSLSLWCSMDRFDIYCCCKDQCVKPRCENATAVTQIKI